MSAIYIFRIDDVTPGMNWDNLLRLETLFDRYQVSPIIGVVPDNQDPNLDRFARNENFWGKIRALKDKGWIIAQHGYQHKYNSSDGGIIGLNNYGEFSGIDLDTQEQMIKQGKELLERNIGCKIQWWMAPAHSFDHNTCTALRNQGFNYITDGVAITPFIRYNLKWLPQQLWKPEKKLFGVWTICLHINDYGDEMFNKIEGFLKEYSGNICSNPELIEYKNGPILLMINKVFGLFFWGKIFVYNLVTRTIQIWKFAKNKVSELKTYGGVYAFIFGLLRSLYLSVIQKYFKFHTWHTIPIEWRPYGLFINNHLRKNQQITGEVVEIGCGLGDLGSGITQYCGYDISDEVIAGGKFLGRKNLFTGSFEDVNNRKISFLVCVNFIHELDTDFLRTQFANLCNNNEVNFIIVDEINNNTNYQYNHVFSQILPSHFQEVERHKEFLAGREIVIFKNTKI